MKSFTMPWPEKQVWPNWRQSHHWRSYYKQVKAQRALAWALAKEAGISKQDIVWADGGGTVAVKVDFYPPNRIRRDRDGMAGAAKSILDGLSDAMVLDDQYFAPVYTYGDVRSGGAVVVTLG